MVLGVFGFSASFSLSGFASAAKQFLTLRKWGKRDCFENENTTNDTL
jgi:hypothetical protein